jgi:hypothetical protein
MHGLAGAALLPLGLIRRRSPARTWRVLDMAAAGGISQACARLNMTGLRAATSGTPAGAGGCWRRRAEELRAGTSGGGW